MIASGLKAKVGFDVGEMEVKIGLRPNAKAKVAKAISDFLGINSIVESR